jgi:hypothetical protein
MIRIFWFALICLIGLGVLAATKMAGPLTTADVSQVEAPAPMIGDHDALAKADKLKVFHVEPVPEPTVVTPVATEPSKIAPKAVEATKIVSRHWHDPLAPKASSR